MEALLKSISSEPSQHLQELLERLNVLRKEESLCDVTITVKGKKFKAHGGVLAAASPFLLNLLTSNMRESREKLIKIQLEEASVAVMEDVLKYIYTGNVLITEERAHDLIATADYLLLPGLKTMAGNFLKDIVTTENCLVNNYFAEKFHCEELKAKSREMINSNFSAVMETDDFLNLSVKQVKEWVSSDHIIINAEEEVFQGIVRWVSHNKSEREGDFPELLDKVRISSLTHNFVLHELEREELVTENDKLGVNFLLDTLKLMLNSCDGQVDQEPRNCMEMHLEGIFVCGGGRALCCFPGENSWHRLNRLADAPFRYQYHSPTLYKNKIFMSNKESHSLVNNFEIMEYYMPSINSWAAIQLRKDVCDLTSCTYAVLEGALYAKHTSCNEVYKYDAECNHWRQVDKLINTQENSCLVTDNKYLYFIGGKRDGNALTTTTRFDPSNENSRWKTLAALNERRYGAFGATMKDKVYIAGGVETSGQAISSCEVYNPNTDEWLVMSSLREPRMFASMICFNGILYVLGGRRGTLQATYNRRESRPKRVTNIEEFDVEKNEWTQISTIPIKGSDTVEDNFKACSAKLFKGVIDTLQPLTPE
ncbi:kelch-like protein 12 [Montipora capricornis]|uniref:kelch-like protein 12 n=1 Tax=Montipora capricornis TaxID=246305 RepID=UPI0035F13663